jgi:hypothetical protein
MSYNNTFILAGYGVKIEYISPEKVEAKGGTK